MTATLYLLEDPRHQSCGFKMVIIGIMIYDSYIEDPRHQSRSLTCPHYKLKKLYIYGWFGLGFCCIRYFADGIEVMSFGGSAASRMLDPGVTVYNTRRSTFTCFQLEDHESARNGYKGVPNPPLPPFYT